MLRRRILLLPLLLAAGGGPVLLGRLGLLPQNGGESQADQTTGATATTDDGENSEGSTLPGEDWSWTLSPTGSNKSTELDEFIRPNEPNKPTDQAGLSGRRVNHVGELFRMDITPRWVIDQWRRVSQTVSPRGLQGMRVPLVISDNATSLYGSLTYYFDAQQRVQRIQFHGFAKNPDPWIVFIAGRYHLRRHAAFANGLYVSQWNGAPTSVLRATFGSGQTSLRADDLQIALELNRPSAYYRLSDEFYALLKLEQQKGKRAP